MRTVVGVLRGGPSHEYEVSLSSGASVLQNLNKELYDPRDIFVSRSGEWHLHGVPVTPEKALRSVDVAFNVLHGDYGENGQVQRMLESFGMPYTGSDAFSSAIAFNKQHTKDLVQKLGLKVPHSRLVDEGDDLEDVAFDLFRTFPHPVIIKPIVGGSSVGTTLVDNFHALQTSLEKALSHAPKALIEEYIKGKEATVGVVDGFRGEKTYSLFPVEIVPGTDHGFYSYEAKYGGSSVEHIPGRFTEEEKKQLTQFARQAHEGLTLSHYSRSDFIVSKRGIYFLEINSAAACELAEQALIPKALKAVGSSLMEFLDHVIQLARARKKG